MSILLSLKSEEQKIIAELEGKICRFFQNSYFDSKTGDMEYNLANLDPLQEISVEADEIVKKPFAIWRERI